MKPWHASFYNILISLCVFLSPNTPLVQYQNIPTIFILLGRLIMVNSFLGRSLRFHFWYSTRIWKQKSKSKSSSSNEMQFELHSQFLIYPHQLPCNWGMWRIVLSKFGECHVIWMTNLSHVQSSRLKLTEFLLIVNGIVAFFTLSPSRYLTRFFAMCNLKWYFISNAGIISRWKIDIHTVFLYKNPQEFIWDTIKCAATSFYQVNIWNSFVHLC